MRELLLSTQAGLFAFQPSPDGATHQLLPLLGGSVDTASTAATLAWLAALGRGDAALVDLDRFMAAASHLDSAALVQAIQGAALLGSSDRPLHGLPAALRQCATAVPGVPSLPDSVVCSAWHSQFCGAAAAAAGPSGSGASGSGASGSGGGGGSSPSPFQLMQELRRFSALGSSSPAIQLGGPELGQQPQPCGSGGATAGQAPAAAPAAALRLAGQASELWVRWGGRADQWCVFRQAQRERPTARCCCGYPGLGLLYCQHLMEAHAALLAAPDSTTAVSIASGGSGDGSGEGPAPALLNVSSLDWACSQLNREQLAKLLLCISLYTGAGTVLAEGLSLSAAELAPQEGAPGLLQALALRGTMPGDPLPAAAKPAVTALPAMPGCSLGSWSAAAPAAAGGGRGTPLLEYAAALLPPVTAEGVWASLGLSVGMIGLPARSIVGAPSSHAAAAAGGVPSGELLLQAAELLLSAGQEVCGLQLLKEWVVALSAPAAWQHCKPVQPEELLQLWQQHVPPAAAIAWWMQQLPPAGDDGEGSWRPYLRQQRQHVFVLCGLEYLDLISKLIGPVAGAQLAASLRHGLQRAAHRSAALSIVDARSPTNMLAVSDFNRPLPQLAACLGRVEGNLRGSASGTGGGTPREELERLAKHLDKAAQRGQQGGGQPASGKKQPKKKGKGKKADATAPDYSAAAAGPVSYSEFVATMMAAGEPAAGGAATAGQQQEQQQKRGVGPPSLLLTAAHATLRQLLDLPLDQASDLYSRLVPDLQELTLAEMAAVQARFCRSGLLDPTVLMQKVQDRCQQHRQEQQHGQQPAASAVAGRPAGSAGAGAGSSRHQQQRQRQQQPDAGLRELLCAAVAPQPAIHARRLRLAACRLLLDMCQRQGPAAVAKQLAGADMAGWWAVPDLLQSSSADEDIAYADVLPAALFAVTALLRSMQERHEKQQQQNQKQQSKQQQGRRQQHAQVAGGSAAGGGASASSGPHQHQQSDPCRLPADMAEQLAYTLPHLLADCCAAALDALSGDGDAEGWAGGAASGTVSSCRRPADREGLVLALAGIHSCLEMLSEVIHAAPGVAEVAARLDHPAPQLLALPPLLAVTEAGAALAEAADRCSQGPAVLQWATRCNDAAAALLALLPRMPLPVTAAAAASSASKLAGVWEGEGEGEGEGWEQLQLQGPRCLLDLLPQMLAASGSLQRCRHSEPPRRSCLALLCRCLHAMAAADAGADVAPAELRLQAGTSLLRLILSPAVGYELQQDYLHTQGARQLAQLAFEGAAQVLPAMVSLNASSSGAGSSTAGSGAAEVVRLAGECAYLAVNVLANTASARRPPEAFLMPLRGAGQAGAAQQKEALGPLLRHADWQLAALRLLDCWLRLSADLPAGEAAGRPFSGPPPALFCASTLVGLMSLGLDVRVLAAALAALQRLAGPDPCLLLRCEGLPLLVHFAAKKAYQLQASTQLPGHSWNASEAEAVQQLQQGVDALLGEVKAAASHSGQAGATALSMWHLWRQRRPAGMPEAAAGRGSGGGHATGTMGSGGGSRGGGGGSVMSGARAAPWDRLTAAAATLVPAGTRSHPARAAEAGGSRAWEAAYPGGVSGPAYPGGARLGSDPLMHLGQLMGGLHPMDLLYGYGGYEDEDEDDYDDELEEYEEGLYYPYHYF